MGKSEYMEGGGYHKFFLANVPAIQVNSFCIYINFVTMYTLMLQRGDFKSVGYYAGMSAIQGGPGFPILSEVMYSYMISGQLPSVNIEDENLPLPIKSLVAKVM